MKDDVRINVFEYLDYRRFLRDLYNHKKATTYGFSYRAFSARAGLRSTNYLKLVIDGDRNLTSKMAMRFADACDLSEQEAEYFCDLVEYNQAHSSKERAHYFKKLSACKRHREVHKLTASQSEYHSQWYLPAIREMAACKNFVDDPAWIAETLLPNVTRAQAKKALDTLLKIGLLERDADGRLQQKTKLVTTGEGPHSAHITSYHLTMLERAAWALENVPRTHRDVSALTLCVSEEAMLEIKHRIGAFRKELLQIAELKGRPERVVQINFQLFPLTNRRKANNE